MIQLRRPAPPLKLAERAPTETQALWDLWARGIDLPKVKSSVYAHPDVKQALRNAQSDKCAFCETINPSSHDVVEHFRPKDGWRQNRGEPLNKPNYFWLAYEWSNLMFVCDVCNDQAHKGNLFPLGNAD